MTPPCAIVIAAAGRATIAGMRGPLALALAAIVAGACGGASRPAAVEPAPREEVRPAPVRRYGAPRVVLVKRDVDGALDGAKVQRALEGAQAAVEACYAERLRAIPTLEGGVEVTLSVTRRGAVAGAAAMGVDNELATCVVHVIRGLRFPRPKGGGTAGIVCTFGFSLDG